MEDENNELEAVRKIARKAVQKEFAGFDNSIRGPRTALRGF